MRHSANMGHRCCYCIAAQRGVLGFSFEEMKRRFWEDIIRRKKASVLRVVRRNKYLSKHGIKMDAEAFSYTGYSIEKGLSMTAKEANYPDIFGPDVTSALASCTWPGGTCTHFNSTNHTTITC